MNEVLLFHQQILPPFVYMAAILYPLMRVIYAAQQEEGGLLLTRAVFEPEM